MDFKRFRIYLQEKYKVEKAFLFIGYVADNQSLYLNLQKDGFIVVFKPSLQTKNGIKGNCDAELVLHCMIELSNFSKAVIISGDGDFHCLIEYLAKENKLESIGIPNKTQFSGLLRKFSPYMFYVSDQRKRLEFRQQKGASAKGQNPKLSSSS